MTNRQRVSEFECTIPFNPLRKRQATVYRPYKGCSYVRIVVKGAPEKVLQFCTKQINYEGQEEYLDESRKERLLEEDIIGQFAKNGLRTFAYAYKDLNSDTWEDLQATHNNFAKESDRDIIESDLIFVSAFGIIDDLRDGVEKSIAKLRMAGINTRMISGDNLETAIVAAKKAGIL